ncbi:MgtC/SapB family protein [Gracilibacillus alcaliphilus]|uniref:MgtC/SapB family protein n=1 Tax=Gracilibacillus alcaliphilus TaxID=1401441 RepID=UPI00195EEDBF|nr:MgtC/SapB family protein [Gracilibacillus alcaliphilus]MBM7679122.1 putative Mg2+ transporter-C (MgtC) family protein [Gracilibacillus alcaliphilus]
MDIGTSLLRLGLAALLGIMIGLERKLKNKPLGLKTCIVISVSSCLLTIISIEAAVRYGEMTHTMRTDPMRLAAQIVSGIGFIGAGVILKRGDNVISGITTAAIIWGAAGLGIGAGAGFYLESIIGALIILFSVEVLPYLVKKFGPKQFNRQDLKVTIYSNEENVFDNVLQKMKSHDMIINKMRVKDVDKNERLLQLNITLHQSLNANDVYSIIRGIPTVKKIEVETT